MMKWIALPLAWTLVGLGFLGIFVPGLPSVFCWLIAAYIFAKYDPRMYAWMRAHPRFGKDIADFIDHGTISARGKRFALIGMGFGACFCTFILWNRPWILSTCLIGLAAGAIFVATRQTSP